MESAHIMYMWISMTACICICIGYCNWLWNKNDKSNNTTDNNTTNHDSYDPDAMP